MSISFSRSTRSLQQDHGRTTLLALAAAMMLLTLVGRLAGVGPHPDLSHQP